MKKNKLRILILSISSVLFVAAASSFIAVSVGEKMPFITDNEKNILEKYNLRTSNGFFDVYHNFNIYKSRTFNKNEILSFPKATQNLIDNKITFFSWLNQLKIEYDDFANDQVIPFYPPGIEKDNEISQINNIIWSNANAIIFLISSIIWFLSILGIALGIFLIIKNKKK